MTAPLPSQSYQQEPDDIEGIFNDLVQVVIQETRSESSTVKIAIHPAYQQIIGLGTPVVPLLLRELERRSGRWFWALKAISRFDPVATSDRGRTGKIIEAWLQRGTDAGYKW